MAESGQGVTPGSGCVSIRRQGSAGGEGDTSVVNRTLPENHGTSWTMNTGVAPASRAGSCSASI